jgi:Group II intron, maturase-specific domain
MGAKNEGWQVSAKALGESVHQQPADKLVRRDRHGFPAARSFDAIVLPAERHAPIIGCDQPAVRDGNGLHLAWGANFLRFLLQRGQQELCRAASCCCWGHSRHKGASIKTTMEELATYMRGWRGYFGYCETPEVLVALTRWVRLRLRAVLAARSKLCPTLSFLAGISARWSWVVGRIAAYQHLVPS